MYAAKLKQSKPNADSAFVSLEAICAAGFRRWLAWTKAIRAARRAAAWRVDCRMRIGVSGRSEKVASK